jgi:endoglucanase
LAVSTHAYFPFGFASDQKGTDKFTNLKDVDDTFARLNNKFILNGIPVIMGEWASTHKNNLDERVKHAEYYVKAATKYGIPTVWWDNGHYNYSATSSDIMGLLNRNNNTWVYPEILDALMRGKQ